MNTSVIKKRYKKTLKYISKHLKTGFKQPLNKFLLINLFFVWLKTIFEYFYSFNLGITTIFQLFLSLTNPIPFVLLVFGISLFFYKKTPYFLILLFNLLFSLWLFSNVLYYREFSDFLSFSIMGSTGTVGNNLSKSLINIISPTDFLLFVDVFVILVLMIFKKIKLVNNLKNKTFPIFIVILSFVLMLVNLKLSEIDRPGLIKRSFDSNYIVKYLGINEYIVVNGVQTFEQASSRRNATREDLKEVQNFIDENKERPDIKYLGKEEGKNVIAFHLESFQQFLIDYKVEGREVTPNLNQFYRDQNTISFDNFFHQVGQGKTSDAELMLDNSLYGLSSGSAMVRYGTKNTFTAFPKILSNKEYTSATFHADVPSFWNRINTYRSWGFNYFFSDNVFEKYSKNKKNNLGYGLKDELFLKESQKYLTKLPQPFYAKMITVTNHYPYEVDEEIEKDFPSTKTGDETVDHYVQTAHYADEQFGEFIKFLKDNNLYDDTLLYVYGDHYGISENHPDAIAKLLGRPINDYDLLMWQKVPFMIHANNLKGRINHTFGGEIDVMPTIINLLGLDTSNLVIFGNDLLSQDHKEIVPFRNGDWTTPKYSKHRNKYFFTQNGEEFNLDDQTPEVKKEIKNDQKYTDDSLKFSDMVIHGDLLRFQDNIKTFKNSHLNYTLKDINANIKK